MMATLLVAGKHNEPPAEILFIFVAVAAGIAALVYFTLRAQRQRREALAQAAMEMGFIYSAEPDPALAAELAQIHVADVGQESHPRFANVLQGTAAGCELIMVDRTIGSGKSSSTATVAAFKFAAAFPTFMLCPENVLWRVADKLGYHDIDLESAPEFSRRYFLHGDDDAAVRALFQPDVVRTFEQLDAQAYMYVCGSGHWLVVYRPGVQIAPDKLREFLQPAEAVVAAFRRAQPSGVFKS
jgi:hypothetical protein